VKLSTFLYSPVGLSLIAAGLVLFQRPLPVPLPRAALHSGMALAGPGAPELAQSRRDARRSTLSQARVTESYGRIPLSFEANTGQTDSQVKFLSRGSGYTLFLTGSEAVLSLHRGRSSPGPLNAGTLSRFGVGSPVARHSFFNVAAFPPFFQSPARALAESSLEKPQYRTTAPGLQGQSADVLRMKLVGANPMAKLMGLEELPGKANYFIGNDPNKWRTNVSTYARVRVHDVYPGVDLVYYGNQRQLEHDFVVVPGADPSSITIGFEGAEKLSLDSQGNLVLAIKDGEVRFRKPLAYQELSGLRRSIAAGYFIKSANEAAFQVGAYDTSRPLIIDPVLAYSTYLGGSSQDDGLGVAVDGAGNAYVTGCTTSTNFPTTSGALQSTAHSVSFAFTGPCLGSEVFVTKLNPTGSAPLVYSTYLAGSFSDVGLAIAVDAGGNAYVAGQTNSSDFPTTPGAFQTSFVQAGGCFSACPCFNGFVTKLNPSGSGLVYSTFLGGSGTDYADSIAIDGAGNAYVGGNTQSFDFPTTSGAFQTTVTGVTGASCGPDAGFVTKLNSTGSALVYSTYMGNGGGGVGGVAVDSSGNTYIAGRRNSPGNFPTTSGAFQTTFGGGSNDGLVVKLNPTGTGLVYATYLGGNGDDQASAIAIDSLGDAYVSGLTNSTNFPTANPLQAANGGDYDAFVTKINPFGTGLVYATYLGGNGFDQAFAIAIDSLGDAYVTGITHSTNFPTVNAIQPAFGGSGDAFITKMNSSGIGLVYSTYLGSNGQDAGISIAVDTAGNAYVTGATASANFPTTSGAFQTMFGGGTFDAFVAKVVSQATTSTALSSSANPSLPGQSVTFTATVSSGGTPITTATGEAVTFTDGSTTLGTGTLNASGQATFSTSTLAVGTHWITAAYPGDSNFAASTSSPLTQNVTHNICALYDQTRSVNSGAVFPIKVELCDVNGIDVSSSTVVLHATAITLALTAIGAPESPGNANPDNDFRFDSTLGTTGGYIYNLSTRGLAPGTYSLQFTASGDAITHSVIFGVN